MSAVPVPSLSPSLQRLQSLFAARAVPALTCQYEALEQFLALGLPVARDEAWKYTSLRRFESRVLSLPEAVTVTGSPVPHIALTEPGWQHLEFLNGRFAPGASSALDLQPGVRIRPLQQLLRDAPEEAATLLATDGTDASSRFALLNQAFAEEGLVIDVADDVTVEAPLHVLLRSAGANARWLMSPLLILRTGRHSRITIVEQHVSADRVEHVVNAVTRIAVGDGAQVEHYRLQQEGSQVLHFGHLHASVGKDANLRSHTLALGGLLGRLDLLARLSGPGAHAELNGVFLANGTRHLDTRTCIEHLVPHTTSSEDYRGLADGRGRGVFNGKVIVHEQAQKTDARQTSRNLLLSPTAEIDTRPELEIYADDVKCSHGATTGQLDPLALFYLRSRGIAEAEARGLLALAFVDAVVGRMALEPVRRRVHDLFQRHFLQGTPGAGVVA